MAISNEVFKNKEYVMIDGEYMLYSQCTTSDAVIMRTGNGSYSDDTNTLQKAYDEMNNDIQSLTRKNSTINTSIAQLNETTKTTTSNLEAVNKRFGCLDIVDCGQGTLPFENGQCTWGYTIQNIGTDNKKIYSQLGAILVNGYGNDHVFAATILDADPSHILISIRCVDTPTLTGNFLISMICFMRRVDEGDCLEEPEVIVGTVENELGN